MVFLDGKTKINELEVFTSSTSNTIYSSRLIKLNLSDNLQSPIFFNSSHNCMYTVNMYIIRKLVPISVANKN